MDTPERTLEPHTIGQDADALLEPVVDDMLAAQRSAARGIVVAGRDKIDRALSGDSVGYLRRAVQQGGE